MPRTMGGKIGFVRSGMITPMVIEERVRSRAPRIGRVAELLRGPPHAPDGRGVDLVFGLAVQRARAVPG